MTGIVSSSLSGGGVIVPAAIFARISLFSIICLKKLADKSFKSALKCNGWHMMENWRTINSSGEQLSESGDVVLSRDGLDWL